MSNSEEMGVVDDFCKSLYSGGTPATSKAEYWDGDLPWLSSGETRQRFIIDTEKSITQLGVEKSSTKLAHSGDIVMASAGQGFTRGQTSMLFFDTYVNQSVLVLHPKPNAGNYLFLQLAKSYDMLRAWSDSTSTRGSISGKLLRQFKLPLLDGPQLEELENFCSPHFKLIESNLRETKTLTALRDALLPKLMAGEIDVSEIDLTQLNSHLSEWLRRSRFLLGDRYAVRLIVLPYALDTPRQVFRLCRLPILSSRFGFRPGRILLRCLSFGR